MKCDLAYFAVLCLAQLVIFSVGGDFMYAYNHLVWAGIAAAALAAYPWILRARRDGANLPFVPVAGRAAAIYILSSGISFLLLAAVASHPFLEWQLGLFLIAAPAGVASIAALLVSYGVLRLTASMSNRSCKRPQLTQGHQ